MSTRRNTRSRQSVAGGPAVHSEMEPLPSKVSTAYGSPTAARIYNPREGQYRDLRAIVSQLAREGDKTELEDERSSSPERQPEDAENSDDDSDDGSGAPSKQPSVASNTREPALRPLTGTDFNTRLGFQSNPSSLSFGQTTGDSGQTRQINAHRDQAGNRLATTSTAENQTGITSRRSRAISSRSTPPASTPIDTGKSYGTESAIYGSATFASSPRELLSTPGQVSSIPEETSQPDSSPENKIVRGAYLRRNIDNADALKPSIMPPKTRSSGPASPGSERGLPDTLPSRRRGHRPSRSDGSQDFGGTTTARTAETSGLSVVPENRAVSAAPETAAERSSRPSRARLIITGDQNASASMRHALRPHARAPNQNRAPPTARAQPRDEPRPPQGAKSLSWWDTLKWPFQIGARLFWRPDEAAGQPRNRDAGLRRARDHAASTAGNRRLRNAPHNTYGFMGSVVRRILYIIREGAAMGRENIWHPLTFVLAIAMVYSFCVLPIIISSSDGLRWYGRNDISHNLGQFIPTGLLHPLSFLGDKDVWEAQKNARMSEYELTHLLSTSKAHDLSIQRLEKILPKVVKMTLDSQGKPIITQSFWHALRDLMKQDASVLTFDTTGKPYSFDSEEHWKAIKRRLQDEGGISNAADSKSWQEWLANNEKRQEARDGGALVTREAFIKQLESELAKHRNQISAEIKSLQTSLDRQIQTAVAAEVAKNAKPLTRADVEKIVRDEVGKKTGWRRGSVGLDAVANSNIRADWQENLKNQINFLSQGTDAVIDAKRTSPTWIHPAIRDGSHERIELRGLIRRTQHSAVAALKRWEDDGECWCGAAGRDELGREQGVSLAVLLGRTVIPRHVIVEHVLPNATLDAGARPRDIEVFAYFQEVGERQRVQDFSSVHFAERDDVSPLEYDGFVKIGEFTYHDLENYHDDVYIYQVPPALAELGIGTDQLLVRAVNNYGAKDHTCFYRVRLYGELGDVK